MMPVNFIDCVKLVFIDEGGYINDPLDKGGETKFGISKRAYPNEDIKQLSYERARYLYKRDYWDAGQCELLPAEIRYIHFDTCINCGIRTAIRILQRTAKVKDDGIFGKQTLEAAKKVTLKEYGIQRLLRYDNIIEANPAQIKFKKGWYNRVERIINLKNNSL